jgi:antiviral helicase SKI2
MYSFVAPVLSFLPRIPLTYIIRNCGCIFSEDMFLCIRLYDTAIKLGKLQAEFKIPVDPEEYARDNLKFGLVEVVYEWAKVCTSCP